MKLKVIAQLFIIALALSACSHKLKRAELVTVKGTGTWSTEKPTPIPIPPLKENQVAIVRSEGTLAYDFEIYENYAISKDAGKNSLARKIVEEVYPWTKFSEIYRICMGQEGSTYVAKRVDVKGYKSACILPDSTFIIY